VVVHGTYHFAPFLFFGSERERRRSVVRGEASRPYLTAGGLIRLRERLSQRDLAVLHQVAELRLMSVRQIQRVHFPVASHGNIGAATRASQRVLKRLTAERLLQRLSRQIGGVRAGSSGYLMALGPVGQRLLFGDGRRQRDYEPGLRFVDHTLAISQVVVELQEAAQRGILELLECQAEPRSWRQFGGLGGGRFVRADLFLVIGSGEYELRWFAEIDRSTESLPVIARKCRVYADYYQSGVEQAQVQVFPRVCWITRDESRAERLTQLIARDQRLPDGLFVVTTAAGAADVLRGGDV
jgi:hypothetical protein